MSPNLKELIENNEVSEMEVVEFLATLKKLSQNNVKLQDGVRPFWDEEEKGLD